MPDKTDLFYMPLKIEDLWRSTMLWDSDAQFIYRLLLEVHWLQRGILPKKIPMLRKLCRLEGWKLARFEEAFQEVQGAGADRWEKPKFQEDEFGLYNARGRAILREVWEPRVTGHKGNLKQWGCRPCRENGKPIDLGDGWVRECPQCKLDLWSGFEEIPWLPTLVPKKGGPRDPTLGSSTFEAGEPTPTIARKKKKPQRPKPKPKAKSIERAPELDLKPANPNNSEAAFCLAIESVVGEVLDSARMFNQDEAKMVMGLYEEGIPAEVAVRTIRDVGRRYAAKNPNRPLRTVKYFLAGDNGGAIRESWAQIKKLQDATASDDVVAKAAPVSRDSRSWEKIRSSIADKVSREEFDTWFAHLPVAEATPGRIVLKCPNQAIQGILQADFREVLDASRGGIAVDFVS